MTPKEMHIGIDIGLQMITSNRKSIVEPKEKDWILNQAVLQFINTRVNPKSNPKREGFEDTQKRYDDLADIKNAVSLTVYVNKDYEQFCVLPCDYLHLVNDRSILEYNCNGFDLTTSNIEKQVCYVSFTDDNTTGAKYGNFNILLDGVSIFNISSYPIGSLYTNSSKFEIINIVLEEINKRSDIEVYWERYDNIYKKDQFIFISLTNTAFQIDLNYSGYASGHISSQIVTYVQYNNTFSNLKEKENRLVSSEHIYAINDDNYGKTSWKSPLSALIGRRLKVLRDDDFVIDSINIEYIRRPRFINIEINQGCEIHPNFHQEIVDIAVQKIKARTEDPGYEAIVQENLINQ